MTATTTVLTLATDRQDAELALCARRIAERHEGRTSAGHSGALTVLFPSASGAVRAAVAIQQELVRRRQLAPTAAGRIGIDIGDDVGSTKAMAARLCDAAGPDEILVSAAVRAVASAADVELVDAGDVAVPGVARVAWAAANAGFGARVVVADDAALIRAGLVRLLSDAGFDVVGEAADATALLEAVEREDPDLVVTDVRMPPDGTDDGLRAALAIRASHPRIAVLVVSQHLAPAVAADLLDDRASGVGYLLKERITEPEELLAACRHLLDGGRAVDTTVAERLMARRRRGDPLQRLTDRERSVLEQMASGRSNRAIAQALSLSAKTVESHVRSIFTKLDLEEGPDEHRRVTAVVRWLNAAD